MTGNHHRIRLLALALGLGLGLASTPGPAQTVGYNVRTGDVWVDTRLGEINDYGRGHRGPFLDEMSRYYGAPRPLLVDLLDDRGWAPADVYYACAIAHALDMPCIEVVRDYDRHPGQGWGAVAKRLGIKPGSPAFHALKRGQVETYGRWGRTIVVDRPVLVDWARSDGGRDHGPSGKSTNVDPSSHGQGKATGRHGNAAGNKGGKGKGSNNGNGNGNGKSRGHGKR